MRAAVRSALSVLHGLQGAAGVVCLAAGAYLLAGLGVALVVFGVFLLLGAWGTA